MSSEPSTPLAAGADFPPEQAAAADSHDVLENASLTRPDLGPVNELFRKPHSSKKNAPAYHRRSGSDRSARSNTPETLVNQGSEMGVLPPPVMQSANSAALVARAAAERRREERSRAEQQPQLNARFDEIVPSTQETNVPAGESLMNEARHWHNFHNSILRQLRAFGVDPNELKVLYAQLGNSTPFARQLSGVIYGADIVSGERCKFEVSTDMVPFYLATTVCMALIVVHKIPVADLYKMYKDKIAAILELSSTPEEFEADIIEALKCHARVTIRSLAIYHTLLEFDTNNIPFAKAELKKIFLGLMGRLDVCRSVIVQKIRVKKMNIILGEVDGHLLENDATQDNVPRSIDLSDRGLGDF